MRNNPSGVINTELGEYSAQGESLLRSYCESKLLP